MVVNKTILIVWLFTLVLAIGVPLASYGSMPDRMASHFNFEGKADRYSSRDSFYRVWFIQIAIVNTMVLIVGWLMQKLPASLINLPNKDYWLATPERRRECSYKTMGLVALIVACVNLFLVGLFQSVVDVNKGHTPSFPFWLPLLLLPLSGIVALVYILRVFKVPRISQPKNPAVH
jgi:uncharacterized membrane protein